MNKILKKSKTVLTDPFFEHPNTSLLQFHFDPCDDASVVEKLKNCSVNHTAIDGKDVYTIDGYFSSEEMAALRDYSERATFSRNSYGSAEAIEKGEKPARSMNGKERWQFFSNPPAPVQELYRFFSTLAYATQSTLTTLPWELCDLASNGSSSILGNRLEEVSFMSMDLGKHQDSSPEKGLPFAIPILYSEGENHPLSFKNGERGRPWIVSVMLYATGENFLPAFKMGTAFYNQKKELVLRTECKPMRIVLFEGDILHSIEESNIPAGTQTWRVSYVFKLIFNPSKAQQHVKSDCLNFLT